MAWISIHEQIIGGKLRRLAKKIKCSQNEALGMLVKFWLWGISNANKYGYIEGADKEDIAEIINIGINREIDPIKAVEAMIETEWIDCDEQGLYIHDWEEWQGNWYKAIELKQKDKERKRRERAAKREQEKQKKPDSNRSEDKETIRESKKNEYSSNFLDFWSVYPRKIGKGEAYKKYNARIKDGWSPEQLKEAAQNYADRCHEQNTETMYIKHPKTFLSDATPFCDYLEGENALTEQKLKKKNGIHNFTQRDYDFDALERQLLEKQFSK